MSNTITNTRAVAGKDLVVQQILLSSDGTEETDLVVYDSSAVATAIGASDSLKSTIMRVQMLAKNIATATDFILEYDASTDVIAVPISLGVSGTYSYVDMDFREQGGIVNLANGTAGATGDVVLTTSALDSGDVVLMNLWVRPY